MSSFTVPPFVIVAALLFVLIAGSLWVALPYLAPLLSTAHHSMSALSRRLPSSLQRLASSFQRLASSIRRFARYPELGGYVHDTQMSQYIPPSVFHYVTGTWTQVAGEVTDTIAFNVAAADQTCTVNIPITVPSNAIGLKGAYLKSVEIDYEIFTAACDAVAVVFNKVTRGADGAAATVAAQTFTYDAGHDTAGERVDVDEHRMTVTLDTPIWIGSNEYVLVELTLDKASTTTVHMLAAVANYTLRL